MAERIQFRRGTKAQNLAYVGPQGEITVDIDASALVVHDGETPGGFPGGGFLSSAPGAVKISVHEKMEDTLSVREFGAKLDGVTDDTEAWRMAIATGRIIDFPEGQSKISGKLSLPGIFGAGIVGRGRHKSQFLINYADFDLSASAVIEFNSVYQCFKKVGIDFAQPSTAVRDQIKRYPAAIDLNGYPRAELAELLIQRSWVGITARGNCGGAVIDDIQISAFFQGMIVDGALDSVRINRFHFWPFGFAGDAALMSVYGDGGVTSMDFGRCDDLNMSSVLSYQGRMIFDDHGVGSAFGVVSNITLDSNYGRLEFRAGELTVSSLYSSTGTPDDFLILQTGGELKIASLALEAGIDLTWPLVSVQGGTFLASDVMVTSFGPNTAAFRLQNGTMNITNGFIRTSRINKSVALIDIVGGRASVTGVGVSDAGRATGDFIKVWNDDQHNISGNRALGWSISTPSDKVFGIYSPNSGTPGGLSGGHYVAPTNLKRFVGVLNSAGSARFAHGVPNAATRCVSVSAHYAGDSGERVMMSGVGIDDTNIYLSGGGSNKDYEAWFQHR